MVWYAVDRVEDGIDLTRDRLWPFDWGTWLRFALLMFFVGGSGSVVGNLMQPFDAGSPPSNGDLGEGVGTVPDWVIVAAIAAVVLVIAIALVIGVLAGIVEFVFVESLRSDTIAIRSWARTYARRGLRLFGFRFVFGLAMVLLFVGPIAIVVWAGLAGATSLVGLLALLMILASPIAIALIVVAGLVQGFTTHFVVPIMLLEDRGVLSAWRRFWPVLRGEWRQFAVFVVVMFLINIAVGLLGGIAGLAVAFVLAIPAGIVGLGLLFATMAASGSLGTIGIAAIAVVVLAYLCAVLVGSLFVSVPLESYRRYVVLLVLGDCESAFDVVADRRAGLDD